jgi:hypothetical protein
MVLSATLAIHDPLGLNFNPLENAEAIADCLENQFTPHDLCDENHKGQLKTGVLALLEDVDIEHSDKNETTRLTELIHSMKLRKACGIEGIPN